MVVHSKTYQPNISHNTLKNVTLLAGQTLGYTGFNSSDNPENDMGMVKGRERPNQ